MPVINPSAAPGSSGAINSTASAYYGFSLHETTGTATAMVRIRSGNTISGLIVEEIALGANESARENYGQSPIAVSGGLYYELVNGSVEGSVRWL